MFIHYTGLRVVAVQRRVIQRPKNCVMAFIRKRGNSYYLVHNVRREGKIQQLHLARLGARPRISDSVIQGVETKHPFVRVDWDQLKEKTSRDFVKPVQSASEYIRNLIDEVRNVHLDLADLHFPSLGMARDRAIEAQLVTELKLLRGTLDVKLSPSRRGSSLNLRGRF
jgi:hypothetical protein